MKRSTFILSGIGGLGAFIHNQSLMARVSLSYMLTPKEEWETYTTDEMRNFARKCIIYGEAHGGRGHSLGAISWNESTLSYNIEHGEPSYGPFGISLRTAKYVRSVLRKDVSKGDLDTWDDATLILNLEHEFTYGADMCIFLFRYHMTWFLKNGHEPTKAWKYAAQRYAGWSKWESREKYGDVFASRAKFLKTLDIKDDELWK